MSAQDEQTRNYQGTHSAATPKRSLLIYHRDGAQVVPLDDTNKIVVIGRAPPSQVQIDDESLSRQHARVALIFGEVWLEDLSSTNGTYVNGQLVTKVRLGATDQVKMGSVTLAVHHPGRDGGAPDLGLDSHDELIRALEHEVVRAKTFQRSLALVLVRGQSHVTGWLPEVRGRLRSVDRMATYSPEMLQVLLPEVSADEAVRTARELSASQRPPLCCGVAFYPSAAATAGAMVEAARTAALKATARDPVGFVGGFASTGGGDVAAPVVGSPAMRAVYDTVRRVARSPLPVLIYGETGTGKELVARAIHHDSPRARGPMQCMNSAAIPSQLIESVLFGHERGAFTGADRRQKGVFEEADGGTVFLDEIGELSLAAQAALLRVLETKRLTRVGSHEVIEVDVRLVAATHRDLEAMCAEGTFRQDLLYRLNAVTIDVPPLRDRPEEIEPLAEHFLRLSATLGAVVARGFDGEALELLRAYTWPGNVRELRNAIERAAVISGGDMITGDDLPERIREGAARRQPLSRLAGTSVDGDEALDLRGQVRELEITLIRRALSRTRGNQTEAAELLGIPRRTLVRRLGDYGIRGRNG